jgi:hypothetical protein
MEIMTAKDKAEELILTYLRIDNNTSQWFNTYIAKQCALIAVNQIIAELDSERVFERIYFWNEVKEEIQKL